MKNKIQIKKSKILIVFDYTIADMLSNKKHNLIVTELHIRGRILNILFCGTEKQTKFYAQFFK